MKLKGRVSWVSECYMSKYLVLRVQGWNWKEKWVNALFIL